VNRDLRDLNAILQVQVGGDRASLCGDYGADMPVVLADFIEQALSELEDAPREQYRECTRCGLVFAPARYTARYCSETCRVGHYRDQQRPG
jgi:hypothetical protein